MRNVKKWLAVAMVAAMTVSMAAGCGSKSEGEKRTLLTSVSSTDSQSIAYSQ